MIVSAYEYLSDGSHVQINTNPDGRVWRVILRGPCKCITPGCTLGRQHENCNEPVPRHKFALTCQGSLVCGGRCRFEAGHCGDCHCVGDGCVGIYDGEQDCWTECNA